VDPSTVHFGDPDDVGFDGSAAPQGGTTPTHGGHDEGGSLLCHFHSNESGPEGDDTEGKLVGLTEDGVPLFGTDNVWIVGP